MTNDGAVPCLLRELNWLSTNDKSLNVSPMIEFVSLKTDTSLLIRNWISFAVCLSNTLLRSDYLISRGKILKFRLTLKPLLNNRGPSCLSVQSFISLTKCLELQLRIEEQESIFYSYHESKVAIHFDVGEISTFRFGVSVNYVESV